MGNLSLDKRITAEPIKYDFDVEIETNKFENLMQQFIPHINENEADFITQKLDLSNLSIETKQRIFSWLQQEG